MAALTIPLPEHYTDLRHVQQKQTTYAGVYQAHDSANNRPVVIKLLELPPSVRDNPAEQAALLERAVALQSTLHHPYIVQVYDSGIAEGYLYVVSEDVEAEGTLQTYLRQHRTDETRMPLETLARTLDVLANALDHLHRQAAVHGNLTPATILWLEDEPVLNDAGLLPLLLGTASQVQPDGTWIGTISYMAPEQLTGNSRTPASDCYALGCIAYELATGHPPYRAESPQELAQRQQRITPPLPRQVRTELSEAMQLVLLRAIAHTTEQRFASGGDFARAFRAALEGHPLPFDASQYADLLAPSPESTASQTMSDPAELQAETPASDDASDASATSIADNDEATPEQTTRQDSQPPAEQPASEPRRRVRGMPATIGRYTVERELGRGAMGLVYLAVDPYMNRQVAIKSLPSRLTASPRLRTQFQHEAELIASLEHPCIVRVYDFGEHDDRPFLVMHYLSGGSLSDRLVKGPMRLRKLSPIIERVAQGLDAAHERGIVHRDVKPGNILFDTLGNAFLSDFGIAVVSQAAASLSGKTEVAGTPKYMSPEQALALRGQSSGDPDGRSDIYSLGVVFFEALTGKTPYSGSNMYETVMAHVKQPIPRVEDILVDVPSGAQEVLDQVLAKDPADRYQQAADFAKDVKELASGRWYLRKLAM